VMTAADFPDFEAETGYRPATSDFIDGMSYDGRQPNAYIKGMEIGLKDEVL
jgi:nitrate/nitrite transport system substrate-binding protein